MRMKSILTGVLTLGFVCAYGGETPTEKTRKAVEEMFPGWSLDTEVTHDLGGFHACHRGQNNVVFVHPKSEETPAILSRTVVVSGKNPCLFLKVASWREEADYLLSVRVNGKDALSARVINTPDFAPWEDIVVPLSDWRGLEAKIEIVLTANNWWCEAAYLARLEIAEGNGDMRIIEGKTTVDGYSWSYRAQNGEATLVAEKDGQFSCAVSPCPIGHITIPGIVDGIKVTRIGRAALRDCSGLTSVTIPDGVVRIGREALLSCTGLRSVTIPSSVKVIEWDAFGMCRALTTVSLSDGLTKIDRGAFYFCYGLTSITIPPSVTHIGQDAFFWCSSLTSNAIPPNVTDVRPQIFRGCNALTAMTISANVTNIAYTSFVDCGAMTSFRVEEGNRFYKSENGLLLTKDGATLVGGVNGDVEIPVGVTVIGPCAFEGSVALRSVVIPPGVTNIGDYAFKQCRGMTMVTIPSSVTDIGCEAFNNCKGIKSISIPMGVTVIRNATFSWSGLTEVVIPFGVKTIERGAFYGCEDLKSVTFQEGLTSIGRDAFYNCGKLTSVTIPSSVTRIEQGAFHGCSRLKVITIPATLADNIDGTAFDGCSKLKSVNIVGVDGKVESLSFDEFCKRRNLGGYRIPGGASLRQRPQRQQKNQDVGRMSQTESRKVSAKVNGMNVEKDWVARQLQKCEFLLNKDFKKQAKYYLFLFSASWCPPCRAEMPRIAKVYKETLKADPDIELIHFSCDQNDEKARAWAKEHDVKFPVVKPKGGNPLDLHPRGIPRIFIIRADGTLVEDGHPASLFTGKMLRELKTGNSDVR